METKLTFNNSKELPVIEGWNTVEFFRKLREKKHKEAHGFPCEEEAKYLENARRNFDEQIAVWKNERSFALA